MVIKASARHFEQAEEQDEELVLCVVTYTGDRAHIESNSINQEGMWPSYGGFTRGVKEVAFVPDRGLSWFERHADFEVAYGKEAVAEALLDKNYLAPEVFNIGAGGDTRQRVLDFLDIDSLATTDEGIREQLAEIAGVDDPGDEAAPTLDNELSGEFTRTELWNASEDLRESTDEISGNAGKTDFAEYLASFVDDGEMSKTELYNHIREVNNE